MCRKFSWPAGKTWAKLPDEYRSILRECARESARYERELWTQQEAAARKTVLAAGCQEIQLSDEEKERFRELVQPLYEKYAGPYLELVKKIQPRVNEKALSAAAERAF